MHALITEVKDSKLNFENALMEGSSRPAKSTVYVSAVCDTLNTRNKHKIVLTRCIVLGLNDKCCIGMAFLPRHTSVCVACAFIVKRLVFSTTTISGTDVTWVNG